MYLKELVMVDFKSFKGEVPLPLDKDIMDDLVGLDAGVSPEMSDADTLKRLVEKLANPSKDIFRAFRVYDSGISYLK